MQPPSLKLQTCLEGHTSLYRGGGRNPGEPKESGERCRENEERGLTGGDEHLRDPVAQIERESSQMRTEVHKGKQKEARHTQRQREGGRSVMGRKGSNGYLTG